MGCAPWFYCRPLNGLYHHDGQDLRSASLVTLYESRFQNGHEIPHPVGPGAFFCSRAHRDGD
ncbi:hypothetical protein MPNT_20037 [Candidatus Methylacidithermus pantelleriae]|uniref:Uncharacterized protein n=1 Tax=Candidatus Methylacidithermus pantelleriae TaxID=2744239 RepID=A0A8J2FVV2_9BACT|nr:hypothetical protein MPNT_20037 [Candidatus Methylacidithermus pantelleriae]